MAARCPDCGAYAPIPGTSYVGGNFHKPGCRNRVPRENFPRSGRLGVVAHEDSGIIAAARAAGARAECARIRRGLTLAIELAGFVVTKEDPGVLPVVWVSKNDLRAALDRICPEE